MYDSSVCQKLGTRRYLKMKLFLIVRTVILRKAWAPDYLNGLVDVQHGTKQIVHLEANNRTSFQCRDIP